MRTWGRRRFIRTSIRIASKRFIRSIIRAGRSRQEEEAGCGKDLARSTATLGGASMIFVQFLDFPNRLPREPRGRANDFCHFPTDYGLMVSGNVRGDAHCRELPASYYWF